MSRSQYTDHSQGTGPSQNISQSQDVDHVQNNVGLLSGELTPHWVGSYGSLPEYVWQTALLELRQQVRFVFTHRLELGFSLHELAERLAAQGWEGASEERELVAVSPARRLVVRACPLTPGEDDASVQRVEVFVSGDPAQVKGWCEEYRATAAQRQPAVRWAFGTLQAETVTMPMRADRQPHPLMFPFLPQPLHALYEAYANSDAPVLVLMGPPGTGKTTFIRGFLQYVQRDAMVCFDREALDNDEMFVRFLTSDARVFVLEDGDEHLRARTCGASGSIMHRFLAISDGLVSVRDKKLIFSTNLPNVSDIDEALLRPGRCFAVLPFRALTPEEAAALADALNWSVRPSEPTTLTLAQWFALQRNNGGGDGAHVRSRVGFI